MKMEVRIIYTWMERSSERGESHSARSTTSLELMIVMHLDLLSHGARDLSSSPNIGHISQWERTGPLPGKKREQENMLET